MRRVALLLLALAAAISAADTKKKDEVCGQNMFQCSNGQCIPTVWRCDGDSDCPDGEDEKECDQSKKLCSEGEYMCKPSADSSPLSRLRTGTLFAHHCIPVQWKCDGEFDCAGKDDEEGCTAVKCRDDQFMCNHTKTPTSTLPSCIPKSWLCDGQADCVDRSDEEGCSVKNKTCEENEFRCADGQCIYKTWQCDGDNDCTDGSDESNCKEHECDKNTKFQCKTAHFCILKKWRCDGEPDCPDHSDELDCSSVPTAHNITCASDEFKCKTGAQCINKDWVCDGDFDCPDESDEHSCDAVPCKNDETRCKSGACRPKSDFCNGIKDCEDGSDEEECSATTVPPVKTPDTCDNNTEYTCPGKPLQCIKYTLLCHEDQAAGHCASDTNMCSEKIHACEPGTDYCVCRKTNKSKKEGEVCACQSGFKILNKNCVDIDECATPGVCDQKCTNMAGGYKCSCYPGYKLTAAMKSTDGEPVVPSKCRAVGDDPLLLLSNRAAIRQYDLHTNRYHPLINKLESAVALDYWYKNQTLVWSDVAKEQIVICRMNQTKGFLQAVSECSEGSPNVTIISKDVSTPDGLAVDWVHGLLFWTDTGLDKINVFDLNNNRRRVLFDKDLDEPRAIAVDPIAGLIFWSDWGHQARIERAGMDGQHRVNILSGDQIRWPNGLALDILEQRLFWADAKMKLISSSDYWGKNIRTVLQSASYLRHPFSIAIFEEKVYWTDWDHEGVLTANKFKGEEPEVIMRGVTGPMTVRVYQQQAQPEHANKCFEHKCQHMCLPKPRIRYEDPSQEAAITGLQYSCACENSFKLDLGNLMECLVDTDVTNAVAKELSGGSGFPILLFLMALVVLFVVGTAFMWYRRRPARPFSALQFDNPIYRRTVEDLDTDMDGVPDNSLGAVHLQPSNLAGQPASRLVLNGNSGSGEPQIDFNDPSQYSYNQPFPQKANLNEKA